MLPGTFTTPKRAASAGGAANFPSTSRARGRVNLFGTNRENFSANSEKWQNASYCYFHFRHNRIRVSILGYGFLFISTFFFFWHSGIRLVFVRYFFFETRSLSPLPFSRNLNLNRALRRESRFSRIRAAFCNLRSVLTKTFCYEVSSAIFDVRRQDRRAYPCRYSFGDGVLVEGKDVGTVLILSNVPNEQLSFKTFQIPSSLCTYLKIVGLLSLEKLETY